MRDAAKGQPDVVDARAGDEEGQVEAVQVVVLDHVGVTLADQRAEAADQVGLCGGTSQPALVHVERRLQPGVILHRDEEDRVTFRVQAGGFEVELEAAQCVEGQVVEVGAPAGDEVLLLRWEEEQRLIVQFAQPRHFASHSRRGADSRRIPARGRRWR